MIKIAHSADWHLSDPNHDETNRVIEVMVKDIQHEKPDLIVISGDMTDSRNTRLESRSARTLIGATLSLSKVAPVVIVSGTPSHDGLCPEILKGIDERIYVSSYPEMLLVENGKISVFDPSEPSAFETSEKGIFISTLPTPTKQFFNSEGSISNTDGEIAKALTGIFAGFGIIGSQFRNKHGIPHVHVGHYQVSGAYVSDTQVLTGVDIDIHPDQIAMINADVVCLGHIHKAQKIKDNIFYSGGITRNTFGEMDEKGYYIHSIADGLTSEFKKLPARNLFIIRKDYLERPIDNIEVMNGLTPSNFDGSWVKIELNVWADEAGEVDKARIESHFYDEGCDKVEIELIRKPRETIRSERILSSKSLKDKVAAMAELRQETIEKSILAKCVVVEGMEQEALIKFIQGVDL